MFSINLFSFFFTLILTVIINLIVIKIAFIKKIFDNPNEERKIHFNPIPNLGGIGMYFSFIFILLFFDKSYFKDLPINNIIISSLILLLIGIKDDLVGLSPFKKFFFQTVSALVVSYVADIRIDNVSGFLGIHEVSYLPSILITTIYIVFLCNSINLIDGINGLAGVISSIISLIFVVKFYDSDQSDLVLFVLGFLGSIVGFLYLNIGNAKIFMGDTGSYFIELILSILSIFIINNDKSYFLDESKFAMIFSIFVVPFSDTIRVFSLRILNKKSPFTADSNHLHHLLLQKNFTHIYVTIILGSFNILIFSINYILQFLGNYILLVLDLGLILAFIYLIKKIKPVKINPTNLD